MAGLERFISPVMALWLRSRVWRVGCARREGGMVLEIVLCEALKLARLSRVAKESGRMVRWFPDRSLYTFSLVSPTRCGVYGKLGTYSLTSWSRVDKSSDILPSSPTSVSRIPTTRS